MTSPVSERGKLARPCATILKLMRAELAAGGITLVRRYGSPHTNILCGLGKTLV